MKIYGYIGYHAEEAPNGAYSGQSLTDADKRAGWSEKPVCLRDDVLEEAAEICEQVKHWGMSPTKLEIAKSTQKFCAKAIRAQKGGA